MFYLQILIYVSNVNTTFTSTVASFQEFIFGCIKGSTDKSALPEPCKASWKLLSGAPLNGTVGPHLGAKNLYDGPAKYVNMRLLTFVSVWLESGSSSGYDVHPHLCSRFFLLVKWFAIINARLFFLWQKFSVSALLWNPSTGARAVPMARFRFSPSLGASILRDSKLPVSNWTEELLLTRDWIVKMQCNNLRNRSVANNMSVYYVKSFKQLLP